MSDFTTHGIMKSGPKDQDIGIWDDDTFNYFKIEKINVCSIRVSAGVAFIMGTRVSFAGATLSTSALADGTYRILVDHAGALSAQVAAAPPDKVEIGQVVVAGLNAGGTGHVISISRTAPIFTGMPIAFGAPAAANVIDVSGDLGDIYAFTMNVEDDTTNRLTGESVYGLYVQTAAIDDVSGFGWHTAIQGSCYAEMGSQIEGIMSVFGYARQRDGSIITSSMYGVTGYVRIDETNAADTPDGYITGVLGIYNTPGVNPVVPWGTPGAKAAIIGCVKDGPNTLPDAAILAWLEGDTTATVVNAAFKAMNVRSAGASGFHYGLDLFNEIGIGPTIDPTGFDLRLNEGATVVDQHVSGGALPAVVFSDPIAAGGYYGSAGNVGITGVLTLDDGANWHLTLTFEDGLLIGETTGASTGQACTWT